MGNDADVMKYMVPLMGVVVMAGVLLMVLPVQAEPTVYYCPICGDPFASMADLEAHFTTNHPSEPIDIIWG